MFGIYFSLSFSNIVKVVNYDVIDYVAETYFLSYLLFIHNLTYFSQSSLCNLLNVYLRILLIQYLFFGTFKFIVLDLKSNFSSNILSTT